MIDRELVNIEILRAMDIQQFLDLEVNGGKEIKDPQHLIAIGRKDRKLVQWATNEARQGVKYRNSAQS
jgi:hypothetical protein